MDPTENNEPGEAARRRSELLARIGDDDESTRAYAAEDAGLSKDTALIAPLIDRLLRERSRSVRETLVRALVHIDSPQVAAAVVPLMRADDPFLRNAAVGIMRKAGDAAIEETDKLLDDPDPNARKLALDVLSGIVKPAAEALMMRALDDDDINVRIAAIEYLGERATPAGKVAIERLLTSADDPMLQATALEVLEPVADTQTWQVVSTRFPSPTAVPSFLVAAWLRIASRVGQDALWPAMLDGSLLLGPAQLDDTVDVLETFSERCPRRSIPAPHFASFAQLLDTSPSIAARARLLKWFGSLRDQADVVELLIRQLGHAEGVVRHGAVLGLVRHNTPRAHEILARHAGTESDSDVMATLSSVMRMRAGNLRT